MAKITLTLLIVAVFVTVQGVPLKFEDVVAAAKGGQWDQVQDLINGDLAKEVAWKPVAFDGVRKLKPSEGGHVYGEAEYTYHSAANINGKTSEDVGGHKVINDDGKIKEYDFTPSTEKPVILNSPPHPNDPLSSILDPLASPAGFHSFEKIMPFNPVPNSIIPISSLLNPGASQSGQSLFEKILPINPFDINNVRNLKPSPGGKVYGEADYIYHSAANINGTTTEHTGGHRVINNNGLVKEFDFTPNLKKPVLNEFPAALTVLDKDISALRSLLNNN